jgi:hypothetical protein
MKKPLAELKKFGKYRGVDYLLRHLYGEAFEILAFHKGKFYSHTRQYARQRMLKRTPYQAGEIASIKHELDEMAKILIDDIVFQWNSTRWERFVENIKGRGRWILYKLSETYDKYEGKYRRARNRHGRSPESGKEVGGVECGDGKELVEGRQD